jgi:hypothetical protein
MANKARNRSAARPASPGTSVKAGGGNGAAPKISATLDGGVAGANRRERKEEARRQREAILRKQARRRYWRIGIASAAAVIVLAGAIVLWHPWSKSGATAAKSFDQANLPGLITTQDLSQWTANTTDLPARISDLGLPPLTTSEQLAFHIHQDLQIFIDGHSFTIPAGIGIDEADGKISVIHVHETDGVIHVESPIVRTFTLGDFFGVWGLNFTPTAIGGFENVGGKSLKVFLNGKPYAGNPTEMPLKEHEIIAVTYGTPQELPQIPDQFSWANSSAGG